MADQVDYSKLSDEEIDKLHADMLVGVAPTIPVVENSPPGKGLSELKRRNEAIRRIANEGEDPAMGMSGPELIRAGVGESLGGMLTGLKEKGQLLFAPKGQAGEDLRAKIEADRRERERHAATLAKNPEAVFGQFLGMAAPAVVAPSRLPAQMAVAGLEGFAPAANSNLSKGEFLPSLLSGLGNAAAMGFVGKLGNAAGTAVNASRGRFTPAGERAMQINRAAENLGLPSPTIGQLDPTSRWSRMEEQNLPSFQRYVASQAEKLRNVIDKPLQLTEGEIPQKGGAYAEELATAVQNRLNLGKEKYTDVDKNIVKNNLTPPTPPATANVILNTSQPGYDIAADELKRYGLDLSKYTNLPKGFTSTLATSPVTVKELNDARIAAGRASRSFERKLETPAGVGNADYKKAKQVVDDLKNAVDTDLETWAANPANREAVDLYRKAVKYWNKDVGATVLDNPLAKQILSKTRGFPTPIDALEAATSVRGSERANLLRPTMTERGADMTDVLTNLPDIKYAAVGQAPQNRAKISGSLPDRILGEILDRTMSTSPTSEVAKRLHFAPSLIEGAQPTTGSLSRVWQRGGLPALRDRYAPDIPLAVSELPGRLGKRAAWGVLQYPRGGVQDYSADLLGRRKSE